MSTYVSNRLTPSDHPHLKRIQGTPYAPDPAVYDRAAQDLPESNRSPLLSAKIKLCVHQVDGSFLYYGQAVDMRIFPPLSEIASQQATSAENTMKKVTTFS